MRFDFKNDIELRNFDLRVKKLKEDKAVVELTKKGTKSPSQHNYAMALLRAYGLETGHTVDEVMTIVKRYCPYLQYEKEGETHFVSFRTKDSKIISNFVDWFLIWASQEPRYITLFTANEYKLNRMNIDSEHSKARHFLNG